MRKSGQTRSAQRLEHLKAVAREAGIKLTHQRLEIFRELAGTEEHPGAEQIFGAVQQRMPTVSLDTVYRTLWMLHDLGLVATVGPQGNSVRFDGNLEHHHHYVCLRCGLVRDFTSDDLNGIRLPAALKQLGSIVNAHVEVRGLCARCQQTNEPSKRTREREPKQRSTR